MGTGISSSLEILFSKMENFVTTKTVVGEPIHIGNVIILPLVDINFAVGAGGSMVNEEGKKPADGGGGGLGAKITPSAVLVIIDGEVQVINLKNQDSLGKLIDMAPGIANKLNLGSLFNKNKKEPDTEKKESVSYTETYYEKDGDKVVKKTETTIEES